MKHYTILILLLLFVISLLAQKHDNIWILGYNGQNPHPNQGGMILDFKDSILGISEQDFPVSLRTTNASISDSLGNLLFYTNGIHIIDASHQIMENGDSLGPYGLNLAFYDFGQNIPQSALILPIPDNENLYAVFHEYADHDPNPPGLVAFVPKFLYTEVDISLNNGFGVAVTKNLVLLEDTLAFGKLTSVKHANGRDWWIFVPEYDRLYTHRIYRFLLTPEGVFNTGKMDAGPGIAYSADAVGNAIFSPDGTKYVRHDIRFNPWNAIDIYDFDRCTGLLLHKEHFLISDTSFLYGGSSISPDSRFLYCVTNEVIYQFDLLAPNIEATKTVVAEYDGHVGYVYESRFGIPQLAPDGKIYIPAYGTDTVVHLIHTPNQPGLDSRVEQHAIKLPKLNDKSIPHFPNFRLGPLDGSPCDTLGLDNHPLAGFTWYAEELAVTFSDNSHYRPEEWAWDFGDGSGSAERNPLQSYGAPGEYYVCLTVSNEYDSDTFCRWVTVDTVPVVGTLETGNLAKVAVFPNPAAGHFRVQYDLPDVAVATMALYDAVGRPIRSWQLPGGKERSFILPLKGIGPGLYFWKISTENRLISNGKLMVMRE